jgi:hypothetical protein
MSYIEKHLLPSENGRLSHAAPLEALFPPRAPHRRPPHPPDGARPAVDNTVARRPALASGLIALAVPYVKRRNSEFAVTNKRVIIKLGVLTTRSVEVLLPKIESITVTQSLVGPHVRVRGDRPSLALEGRKNRSPVSRRPSTFDKPSRLPLTRKPEA